MGRLSHILIYIFAAIALVAVGSCNTNGCLENRTSVPKAGFYNTQGLQISMDSLSIYGIGGRVDSAIVAVPGTQIKDIYLPMRPDADHVEWVFSYKWHNLDYSALNDTLSIDYVRNSYFISDECGVVMNYRITNYSCTSHLIDSLIVADSVINNIDTERMRIYFRTRSAQPDNE